MKQIKGKNWKTVLEYCNAIRSGEKIACKETKQAVERFFRDLEDPAFDFKPKDAEFVIQIIEKTICHQQGETLDGVPLRGKPFLLQPFHKFICYNIFGFYLAGTDVKRFHEALIYIPRKNVKTSFAAGLAWATSLLYRRSGSKTYIVAAAMQQALEAFNFLDYNIKHMGEDQAHGGSIRLVNNINPPRIEYSQDGESFYIQPLAANPDAQDSLNCNCAICDEIHAYKQPKQYNLFKEAMKAYSNKLLIGISTAGDNEQAFLGQRLKYCRQILEGTVKDDQYFIFMCCANPDENGWIDYTNPEVHEMANPSYGESIRPEEFRRSDQKYDWTLEQLARLPIKWYGGADLSRMHDLTAAALFGNYQGIDIVITHAFFPITAAAEKADKDGIPLFGWQDDGLLTMCNSPTVNHADVVNWFISKRI